MYCPEFVPDRLPAKNGTQTCVGPALFSAVGPRQALGNGALFSKSNPYSIRGGTNATVALQSGFLGFTRAQLRQFGTQISISPQDAGAISKAGGPLGPYTVSDLGDQNIQNASGIRFDIYCWQSQTKALKFGVRQFNTQITIPIASGGSCPGGWTEQ